MKKVLNSENDSRRLSPLPLGKGRRDRERESIPHIESGENDLAPGRRQYNGRRVRVIVDVRLRVLRYVATALTRA